MSIRAIVTDIEGTTSSLSFVKDVLFPYARAHLPAFVQRHGDDLQVMALLEDAKQMMGREVSRDEIVAELQHWIDEDRKATPLKSLQGLLWAEGYARGEFHGHLYEDALHCLRAWHDSGRRLYVFSSGSVQAQKLLFAHTAFGDLTPLFAGYFDTQVGTKREASSYRVIAKSVGLPPDQILYLSDVVEELEAARAAGFRTTWLVRDGVLPPAGTHPAVRTFEAIDVR